MFSIFMFSCFLYYLTLLYIYIYIYAIYTILSFSIYIVYPSNKTRTNFIQYAKWSVDHDASFCYFNIFLFIYINIYIQILQFYPSVFPLFTPQIRHVWISFNTQNDQWIKAHTFCFLIDFYLQYFYCLPLK